MNLHQRCFFVAREDCDHCGCFHSGFDRSCCRGYGLSLVFYREAGWSLIYDCWLDHLFWLMCDRRVYDLRGFVFVVGLFDRYLNVLMSLNKTMVTIQIVSHSSYAHLSYNGLSSSSSHSYHATVHSYPYCSTVAARPRALLTFDWTYYHRADHSWVSSAGSRWPAWLRQVKRHFVRWTIAGWHRTIRHCKHRSPRRRSLMRPPKLSRKATLLPLVVVYFSAGFYSYR